MARRRKVSAREILPDPKYGNILLSQFISGLMHKGKRSLAERIMYRSLEIIEQKIGQPGLPIFQKALNNVKPIIEVKSRRVGGGYLSSAGRSPGQPADSFGHPLGHRIRPATA